MFSRLVLLFVVLPIVELWLLLRIGSEVGLLPTLALVFATGVVGATLARAQGMKVFLQFQGQMASGRIPGQALMDGISILVGGAFLLTPGILTDLFGFSLVLPFTRRFIQRQLRKRFDRAVADGTLQATIISSGPHPFGSDPAPVRDKNEIEVHYEQ